MPNCRVTIGKVEKTDPRSADYPLTPLRGLPYGLLHGLPSTDYSTDYPPRTTLNNQPNYFYGEEKHEKPSCSHVHDHNWKQPPFFFHRLSRPSLFHFRPILHWPPASETLFPQWMVGRGCWILLFLICVKCLQKHCVVANVDDKHLTQIKKRNIQQPLPTIHCGNSVSLAGGQWRMGRKWKRDWVEKVGEKWRLFSVMIVHVHVGAGKLFVFFFPVKVIWLII